MALDPEHEGAVTARFRLSRTQTKVPVCVRRTRRFLMVPELGYIRGTRGLQIDAPTRGRARPRSRCSTCPARRSTPRWPARGSARSATSGRRPATGHRPISHHWSRGRWPDRPCHPRASVQPRGDRLLLVVVIPTFTTSAILSKTRTAFLVGPAGTAQRLGHGRLVEGGRSG
jgi:hypothetical protein